MLRNVAPLLTPDILHALRAMGHGDEIAIVDANFPAASNAKLLLRADGSNAVEMLRAVVQVMPLDTYDLPAGRFMKPVEEHGELPSIVSAFQSEIDRSADHPSKIAPVERFEFYERSQSAFAIISTGETRLYGNIILKKGVVTPSDLGTSSD